MKTICVFGSSSETIDREYLSSAEKLGGALARRGYEVVFGAGKYGVMGAVARGAIAAGGGVTGVSPKFFIDKNVLVDNARIVFTDTMRERKAYMEDNSDAFIVCAGGIGTLEEFFEVLTLKQLGRHSKPVILYNVNGFYTPLLRLFDEQAAAGFMSAEVKTLFSAASTESEVFEQLENYSAVPYSKYK